MSPVPSDIIFRQKLRNHCSVRVFIALLSGCFFCQMGQQVTNPIYYPLNMYFLKRSNQVLIIEAEFGERFYSRNDKKERTD